MLLLPTWVHGGSITSVWKNNISLLLRLAVNHPTMDKHILGSLKRLFLERNKEILCSKSPDAYNSCSNATTVHQFIKSHHTFAGCSNMAEYYAENNPIDWIPKVRSWSEYPDNNPDNLSRWGHRYCSSTVRTISCAWRRIFERTLLGEKRSHQLALKSDYKKSSDPILELFYCGLPGVLTFPSTKACLAQNVSYLGSVWTFWTPLNTLKSQLPSSSYDSSHKQTQIWPYNLLIDAFCTLSFVSKA